MLRKYAEELKTNCRYKNTRSEIQLKAIQSKYHNSNLRFCIKVWTISNRYLLISCLPVTGCLCSLPRQLQLRSINTKGVFQHWPLTSRPWHHSKKLHIFKIRCKIRSYNSLNLSLLAHCNSNKTMNCFNWPAIRLARRSLSHSSHQRVPYHRSWSKKSPTRIYQPCNLWSNNRNKLSPLLWIIILRSTVIWSIIKAKVR